MRRWNIISKAAYQTTCKEERKQSQRKKKKKKKKKMRKKEKHLSLVATHNNLMNAAKNTHNRQSTYKPTTEGRIWCSFRAFYGCFFSVLFLPRTLTFHLFFPILYIHLRLFFFGFSVSKSVTTGVHTHYSNIHPASTSTRDTTSAAMLLLLLLLSFSH